MAEENTMKSSAFERHAQTVIGMIVVALLSWAGLKLVSLGEDNAKLRERMYYQGDQITSLRRDLREWSNLYYPRSDAEREIGALQDNVRSLDERLSTLEQER